MIFINSYKFGAPSFSFGNALQFDGVNDTVTLSSRIALSGQFTISGWVKYAAYSSCILLTDGANQNFAFRQVTSTQQNMRILGSNYTFNGASVPLNTWVHVVYTRDSSNVVRCYLNGTVSASTYTNSSTYGISDFGRWLGSPSPIADTIDEFAVWGVTLSGSEITALYNSGLGDYASNYQSGNLLAYWRVNGVSGDSTLVDEKATYNGTLNNFNTSTCWVAH